MTDANSSLPGQAAPAQAAPANADPLLLQLHQISMQFKNLAGQVVHAVSEASLTMVRGETVALVGESGSGKSTLGRIALGLLKPTSGSVWFDGHDMAALGPDGFRAHRTRMQPIFQDPTASLNPRRTVAELLGQALWKYDGDAERRSIELLDNVGLRPGAAYLPRLAHELSGGQRQRLTIARAIAMNPALIIADEPLSGADVSIRGQILNLFLDIRQSHNVAYLMITHDISVARAFADRVAVMQNGKIVETGPAQDVLSNPKHQYTQKLINAVPNI